MINKKSIHSGVKWSFVDSFAAQFISLIFFCITARYVSKEAFGIVAICILTVEAFRQIVFESIINIVNTDKKLKDEDYDVCNTVLSCLGVLFCITVYLISDPIAKLMHINELAYAMKAMSFMLVFYGFYKTYEAKLARNLQFKTLAIKSILATVIGGGTAVIMGIEGFGINSLIAQQLITVTVATVYLMTASGWRLKIKLSWFDMRDLFKKAKSLQLNSLFIFTDTQADSFFSTYYLGAAVAAEYNAAKRLILAITMIFSSSLTGVARSTFAAIQHEKTQLKEAYFKAIQYTALLTTPIFVGLAVLSPDIIYMLLGAKWSSVAPVLSIMCVPAFIASILQYMVIILIIERKMTQLFWLTVMSSILNVVLFVFFSKYGLLVIASILAIKTLLVFFVYVILINRIFDAQLNVILKRLVPAILISGMMGISILLLRNTLQWHSVANVALLSIVGAFLYALLNFIFRRELTYEITNLVLLKKTAIDK